MRADRRLFVVEADSLDVDLAGVWLDSEHGAVLRLRQRREAVLDVSVESEVAVPRPHTNDRRARRHVLGNAHLLVTSQPARSDSPLHQRRYCQPREFPNGDFTVLGGIGTTDWQIEAVAILIY